MNSRYSDDKRKNKCNAVLPFFRSPLYAIKSILRSTRMLSTIKFFKHFVIQIIPFLNDVMKIEKKRCSILSVFIHSRHASSSLS